MGVNELKVELKGLRKYQLKRLISGDEVTMPILVNGVEVGQVKQHQTFYGGNGGLVPSSTGEHATIYILENTFKSSNIRVSRQWDSIDGSLSSVNKYLQEAIKNPMDDFEKNLSEYAKNMASYQDKDSHNRSPARAKKIAEAANTPSPAELEFMRSMIKIGERGSINDTSQYNQNIANIHNTDWFNLFEKAEVSKNREVIAVIKKFESKIDKSNETIVNLSNSISRILEFSACIPNFNAKNNIHAEIMKTPSGPYPDLYEKIATTLVNKNGNSLSKVISQLKESNKKEQSSEVNLLINLMNDQVKEHKKDKGNDLG